MVLTTKTSKKRTGETTTTTGVEAGGKFYPTSNPDFKPSPAGTTTQIKFNENGSVDYTPKGSTETFNLSKQEYNQLQGKAGFETEKTKAIQAQQLNPLQAQQEALAEQQATELQQLGQEDFTQLGQPQPQTAEDAQMISQAPNLLSLQGVGNVLAGKPVMIGDRKVGTGLGEDPNVVGGSVMVGGAGSIAALPKLSTLVSKAGGLINSLKNVKILSVIGSGVTYAYGALTSSKVKDIEGNINDMVSLSNTLSRQVSNGADPVEVRQQLIDMENSIRDKIAELNVAKRYSIKDRLIGSDSQEYARKQLTLIALRRQAVERYILTNDINGFNAFMGAYGSE